MATENLWKALDDLRDAIALRIQAVERLRARLDVEETALEDLRRMQVRFWDRVASDRTRMPSRPMAKTIQELLPAIAADRPAGNEQPSPGPSDAPPSASPFGGDGLSPPAGERQGRMTIQTLQDMSDQAEDHETRSFIDRFSGMKASSDGQAPRGFAAAVRQVAHRSIFKAKRPLRRNEILAEVERAGIPLPEQNAAMKITRVLTRDPDLEHDDKGYTLSPWAVTRQEEDEERAGTHRKPD